LTTGYVLNLGATIAVRGAWIGMKISGKAIGEGFKAAVGTAKKAHEKSQKSRAIKAEKGLDIGKKLLEEMKSQAEKQYSDLEKVDIENLQNDSIPLKAEESILYVDVKTKMEELRKGNYDGIEEFQNAVEDEKLKQEENIANVINGLKEISVRNQLKSNFNASEIDDIISVSKLNSDGKIVVPKKYKLNEKQEKELINLISMPKLKREETVNIAKRIKVDSNGKIQIDINGLDESLQEDKNIIDTASVLNGKSVLTGEHTQISRILQISQSVLKYQEMKSISKEVQLISDIKVLKDRNAEVKEKLNTVHELNYNGVQDKDSKKIRDDARKRAKSIYNEAKEKGIKAEIEEDTEQSKNILTIIKEKFKSKKENEKENAEKKQDRNNDEGQELY